MHRNRGLSAWKRAVCVLLIVTLTLTQSIHIPALSGEEARPRWKLVALLVEKDLWENTTRADDTLNTKNGLTTQDRIRRYAQDIQGAEPETVTMIIPIDRQEAPANIARALEQLYWAGSPGLGGTASTRLDNLVGVVLIGEVPLPVITAQQQKVVSLLPYTDFANKKYFYNATTDTFSAPGSDYDGNPEVWHGLINFPGNESTANQNQINQYLDKNHAWHAGVNEEYTTFNQNVFIADLPRETEKLTTENLTLYQNYLQNWENLVYYRFTKRLAQGLTLKMQTLVRDKVNGLLNEDVIADSADLDQLSPDVQTRLVTTAMMRQFVELFPQYLNEIATLANNSGRWSRAQTRSFPSFIAYKDNYTQELLKTINNTYETWIDESVENIAKDLSIADERWVYGKRTNSVRRQSSSDVGAYYDYDLSSLMRADECSIYRGTYWESDLTKNPTAGDLVRGNQKMVEANRYYNPASAPGATRDSTQSHFILDYTPREGIAKTVDLFATLPTKALTFIVKKDRKHCDVKYQISGKFWMGCCGSNLQIGESGEITHDTDQNSVCLPTGAKAEDAGRREYPEFPVYDPAGTVEVRDRAATYERDHCAPLAQRAYGAQGATNTCLSGQQIQEASFLDCKPFVGAGHYISSVVKHGEPTPQTIRAQIKNLFSHDLPVDNPRYTSFQNNYATEEPQKLTKLYYPNFLAIDTTPPAGQPRTLATVRAAIQKYTAEYLTTINLEIIRGNLSKSGGGTDDTAVAEFIETNGQPLQTAYHEANQILEPDTPLTYLADYVNHDPEKEETYRTIAAAVPAVEATLQSWRQNTNQLLMAYEYERAQQLKIKGQFHDQDPVQTEAVSNFLADNQENMASQGSYHILSPDSIYENFISAYRQFTNTTYGEAEQKFNQTVQIIKAAYLAQGISLPSWDGAPALTAPATDLDYLIDFIVMHYTLDRDEEFYQKTIKQLHSELGAKSFLDFYFSSAYDKPFVYNAELTAKLNTVRQTYVPKTIGRLIPPDLIYRQISLDNLADAIYWQHSSVNEKYQYVFRHFMTEVQTDADGGYQDIYPQKEAHGFESMYLVGQGDAQHFYLNIDQTSLPDEVYNTVVDAQALDNTRVITATQSAPEETSADQDQTASEKTECDSYGDVDGAVPLYKWLPAVICWLKNLIPPKFIYLGYVDRSDYNGGTSPSGSSATETWTNLTATTIDSDNDGIPDPEEKPGEENKPDANQNGILDGQERLAGLVLTSADTLLDPSNESGTRLTVELRDAAGRRISSENSRPVNFKITPSELADRLELSSLTATPDQGLLNTYAFPGSGTGTVQVTAEAITGYNAQGEAQVVTSNPISLTVTDSSISLAATMAGENTDGLTVGDSTATTLHFRLNNLPAGTEKDIHIQATPANLIQFSTSTLRTTDQTATVDITPGQQSGVVEITATADGVNSGRLKLVINPATLHHFKIIDPPQHALPNSTVNLAVGFFDAYDNPTTPDRDITVELTGAATLRGLTDRNNLQPGLQIQPLDYRIEIPCVINSDGQGTVGLDLRATDLTTVHHDLQIIRNGRLVITADANSLSLPSSGSPLPTLKFKVEAQDINGRLDLNTDLHLSLSDPTLATLSSTTLSLKHGLGEGQLTRTIRAGEANLIAEFPQLEQGTFPLHFLPGPAYKLVFHKDVSPLVANGTSTANLTVHVVDEYDNPIPDYSGQIEFKLTGSSFNYGRLLTSSPLTLHDGTGTITVQSTTAPGAIHVLAQSQIPNTTGALLADVIEVKTYYEITPADFTDLKFDTLYSTLVVPNGGDPTQDNLAARWLANHRTQAITSLSADPQPATNLVVFESNGHLRLNTQNNDQTYRVSVGDSSTQLTFDIWQDDKLIAQLNHHLPPLKLTDDGTNQDNNRLYIQPLNERTELKIDETQALFRFKDGPLLATVGQNGQLTLSPGVTAELNEAQDGDLAPSLLLKQGPVAIASLDYFFILPVTDQSPVNPHQQVRLLNLPPTLKLTSLLTGSSSHNTTVLALVDLNQRTRLTKDNYTSLDDTDQTLGVGFAGDYKNQLLFAAGNSVGESTRPHASELVINYGDPTIRLRADQSPMKQSAHNKFTYDLGYRLGETTGDKVKQILPLDFNNDQRSDILVMYENGQSQLFQNNGYHNFKDLGALIQNVDGTRDVTKLDYAGDGDEDLLVSTQGNRVGLMENINGHFIRRQVRLPIRGSIVKLQVADMDQDRFDDLVTLDTAGDLKIFYGSAAGLLSPQSTMSTVANFGLRLSRESYVSDLAVWLDQLPAPETTTNELPTGLSNDQLSAAFQNTTAADQNLTKYVAVNYLSPTQTSTGSTLSSDWSAEDFTPPSGFDSSEAATGEEITADLGDYLTQDGPQSDISLSTANQKTVYFLRGGYWNDVPESHNTLAIDKKITTPNILKEGDTVTTTITIKNLTDQPLTEVAVLDSAPNIFKAKLSALKCRQCGSNWQILDQQPQNYHLLVGHLQLAPQATAVLSYPSTVTSVPTIEYAVGDFRDPARADTEPQDLDIRIFGYNDATHPQTILQYQTPTTPRRYQATYLPLPTTTTANPLDLLENNNERTNLIVTGGDDGSNDRYAQNRDINLTGNPDFAEDYLDSLTVDDNADGIPDSWQDNEANRSNFNIDNFLNEAVNIAQTIRSQVASIVSMVCGGSGGSCLGNLPLNMAFLSPGNFTVSIPPISIPAGWDPGYPIYCTMPKPPFVASGPACFPTSLFRLYISPTLTGGLGIAACKGPYWGFMSPLLPFFTGGNCTYGVVPTNLLLGKLCKKMTQGLNQMYGAAQNAVFSAVNQLGGGGGNGLLKIGYDEEDDLGEENYYSNGVFNFRPIKGQGWSNITPSQFPPKIMEWVKRQISEIKRGLTNLPTIYVVYPDPTDFLPQEAPEGETPSSQSDNPTTTTETQANGWKGKVNKTVDKAKKGINKINGQVDEIANFLQQLPFIKVADETIAIYYPDLTSFDLKLMEKELVAWSNGVCEQIFTFFNKEATPGQACKELKTLRASDIDPQQFVKFDAVFGFIDDIQHNIQALKAYQELPLKIRRYLEWKEVYLGQVISYIDGISNWILGWIARNQARMIKWVEAYRTIKALIQVINKLPKIFENFGKNCSKCVPGGGQSNDRGNAQNWKHLLFSYLIPPIPVIKFPKLWPDIYIDVSHINLELTILLPKFEITPLKIQMPKLPRLNILADPANINISLPHLPRIPMPPNLPDLPLLPTLKLPQLPTIPPPPKLPDIINKLKSVLSVLEVVSYVWCVFNMKWLPMQFEGFLKSTFEIHSQRGGFSPLDFLSLSWPEVSIPVIDKITVDVFVNLNFRLDQITQLIRKITNHVNGYTSHLMNKIGDLGSYGERALDNVLPDSIPVSQRPSSSASTDPLLAAIQKLSQVVRESEGQYVSTEEIRESIINLARELPLTPTEKTEISQTLTPPPPLFSIEKRKQELAQLTTALRSEQQNLHQDIKMLASSSWSSWIASKQQLAATTLPHLPQSSLLAAVSAIGDHTIDSGGGQSSQLTTTSTNTSGGGGDAYTNYLNTISATTGLSNNQWQSTYQTGLYFYNTDTKQTERLINYAEQLDSLHFTLIDIDNDQDEDVLYTLGQEIYLKDNLLHQPEQETYYYTNDPLVINQLSDILPALPAVNNFTACQTEAGAIKLCWTPSESPATIGYYIEIYKSIHYPDLYKTEPTNSEVQPNKIFYVLRQEDYDDQKAKLQSAHPELTDEMFFPISDSADTYLDLTLPNGHYYATIQAYDGQNYSSRSNLALLAPQIFADHTNALVDVTPSSTLNIAVFEKQTLTAVSDENNLDYAWDTHLDEDGSDQDGDTTNDRDVSGRELPLFFEQPLGQVNYLLNAYDSNRNRSVVPITINVYAPTLSLNSITVANGSGQILGQTSPALADLPLHIWRYRFGNLKTFTATPLRTTTQGYTYAPLSTTAGLVVLDPSGKQIATIDETTGQTTLQDSTYHLTVKLATDQLPTRFSITNPDHQEVTAYWYGFDANQPVRLVTTPDHATGVQVIDTHPNDQIIFTSLPSNAPSYPRGLAIVDQADSTTIGVIGSNGDVRSLNGDTSLSAQLSDTGTVTLWYQNQAIADLILIPNHHVNFIPNY